MTTSGFPRIFSLLFSLVLAISSAFAGYVRPNTEPAFFEKELLTLDVDQRSEVARELSALTRNFPDTPAASPGVRARAMTVALMLDPINREAVTTNGMFGNGFISSKIQGYPNYKRLVRDLERLARHLNSRDANEQDKRLGLMMADLVWRLDSQSEVGIAYQELMDRGKGMDWKDYISPEVDLDDSSEQDNEEALDPFSYLRDQEEKDDSGDTDDSEEGEDVFQLPEHDDESDGDSGEDENQNTTPGKLIAGDRPKGNYVRVSTMVSPPAMGYMSSLTHLDMQVATTIPRIKWEDGRRKNVDEPVGDWMEFSPYPTGQLARSNVYRNRISDGLENLQNDYEGWPKGYVAQVSSPRYGRVSGSLGSLATLVGIDALMRGVSLDEDVVILGSFRPDSDVLADHKELATALLRLDHSIHSKVERVIVPAHKADLYCNLLAAVESETAMHFQIIAVDSVREATDLALQDLKGSFKDAIEEFDKIQNLQMRFDDKLRNPHVIQKLADIVEKCPQHVSAHALLKASKMSPYGGATLNDQESLEVLGAMLRPFAHMLEYNLDAITPGEAKVECRKFLMRLYKARRNTSRNVTGAILTAEEFVKELLGFVERKNRTTNSARQQFQEAKEKFKDVEEQFEKYDAELRW